jgi:hypothetical protein
MMKRSLALLISVALFLHRCERWCLSRLIVESHEPEDLQWVYRMINSKALPQTHDESPALLIRRFLPSSYRYILPTTLCAPELHLLYTFTTGAPEDHRRNTLHNLTHHGELYGEHTSGSLHEEEAATQG